MRKLFYLTFSISHSLRGVQRLAFQDHELARGVERLSRPDEPTPWSGLFARKISTSLRLDRIQQS